MLLFLSASVALIDGLGLSLFIPLFQVAEAGDPSNVDLGNLHFVVDAFNFLGLNITVGSILIFMILLFSSRLCVFINSFVSVRTRVRFMKQIRMQLVNGLCNLSYPAFVGMDLGRVQNVITGEIGKAGSALLSYLSTLQAAITLVGYLFLAFLADFRFALLITIAGGLSGFVYKYINKKVETSSLMQSYIGNGLQGKVLESVWNFKYLKATDLISRYRVRLVGLVHDVENLTMKMGKLNAISGALREPVTIAMLSIVIFVQVVVFDVSMFSIALILVFFYRSLTSLLSLQNSWQSFLTNSGGIKTVNELYEEFELKSESRVRDPLPPFGKSIELKNVVFSYESDPSRKVLNDISLEIEKNKTVAFVGESGSGKTTLVNMLSGLLMPVSGKILVDGVELTEQRVHAFRQMIGYITQEAVVFNDTVFNNVTFGAVKTPESLERFWDVIEKPLLQVLFSRCLPKRTPCWEIMVC